MNERALFFADLSQLDAMMCWVQEKISRAGFSLSEARKIELALEEALVNIIHYAYKEKKGSVEIFCRIDPNKRLEFVLLDQGEEFNPLLVKKKPVELPLENRVEGGVGILLIREYMDEVSYVRERSYNRLTLVKKISC